MQQQTDAPRVAEFARFLVVGSVGFAVDCSVMLLMLRQGNTAFASRLASFALAVTVTWALNRAWTFTGNKGQDKRREYAAYVVLQSIGAAINLGVFFAFLAMFPSQRDRPVLALIVGAIPALAFNFAASKFIVFRAQASAWKV